MKKLLLTLGIILALTTNCFGAWDKTKPGMHELLNGISAQIIANWQAIEAGTDTVLQITNAKVAADAGIVDTKLAQITTPNKVSGAALTSLSSIPSGAGALPIVNGGTGATTAQVAMNALAGGVTTERILRGNGTNVVLAQVNLTTDVTGTLPNASGGTGTTAAANAASGVVILDGSSKLPAVDGSALTNVLPAGSVVQVQYYQRQNEVACTTAIPSNNNSRTSSEGTLVLTKAITPKSNSNILKIDVQINAGGTAVDACAILMDGTTVLATSRESYAGSGCSTCPSLTYFMTSPGTSAKTFNVNLGDATASITLNRSGVGQPYDNGKLTSSITITEIKG